MMRVRIRGLAAMLEHLAHHDYRGRALQITIMHDDACTPTRCVCDPDYVLQDLTPESYSEGARLDTEWRRSTSS